jgi:hypothetical protein
MTENDSCQIQSQFELQAYVSITNLITLQVAKVEIQFYIIITVICFKTITCSFIILKNFYLNNHLKAMQVLFFHYI